jgi:Holliday junction resolvase
MDIEIKIDADCVSTEYETILFIKSLIDSQFVDRLQFIKSTYRFARADFVILNTENIKSVIIECKSFKNKPTFLNKSKVDCLRRHYHEPFVVIKHNTDYFWLRVNAIDWKRLPILNEETEPAYDVSGCLSNNYDELGNQILIRLMYP